MKRRFTWDTPTLSTPADARHQVRGVMDSSGLPTDLADQAEVVVSELVTNAVLHGYPPVEVEVDAGHTLVWCGVTDHSPAAVPAPRHAGDCEEHGRGMEIVDMLSSVCGVSQAPGAKCAWFELGKREI